MTGGGLLHWRPCLKTQRTQGSRLMMCRDSTDVKRLIGLSSCTSERCALSGSKKCGREWLLFELKGTPKGRLLKSSEYLKRISETLSEKHETRAQGCTHCASL